MLSKSEKKNKITRKFTYLVKRKIQKSQIADNCTYVNLLHNNHGFKEYIEFVRGKLSGDIQASD